jgi:Tol biopolymer transport system component
MKISGINIPAGVTITAPEPEPTPSGPSKLAVGAWRKNNNAGAAYIYNLDGTGEVKLTASDGASEDYFGQSVAMSDTKVVVGAAYDDDRGGQSGSVYVYNLDGTGELKITASDGAQNDIFGNSVAMSDTHIVVGAPYDNGIRGSVYVYNTDGTGEVKITASDAASSDHFGWSVAMSDTKVVVGAHGNDDLASNTGSVYVYNLDGTGEVKIVASDAFNGSFGRSVAIQGDKIIVGMPGEGGNRGSAYVYNTDGTGEVKLTASDARNGDYFGGSVAISDTKIAVSAMGDDSYTGSAYIYNLDGTGEVKITSSDGTAGDEFGESVAILGDKIVVGASGDDDSGSASGSVYVYNTDGTGEQKIVASDVAGGDKFGRSVAIN